MSYKEIEKGHKGNLEPLLVLTYNKYSARGTIRLSRSLREYFNEYVRVFFNEKQNLLALQPSDRHSDYKLDGNYLYATALFKQFPMPSQTVQAKWSPRKKLLIAKVQR